MYSQVTRNPAKLWPDMAKFHWYFEEPLKTYEIWLKNRKLFFTSLQGSYLIPLFWMFFWLMIVFVHVFTQSCIFFLRLYHTTISSQNQAHYNLAIKIVNIFEVVIWTKKTGDYKHTQIWNSKESQPNRNTTWLTFIQNIHRVETGSVYKVNEATSILTTFLLHEWCSSSYNLFNKINIHLCGMFYSHSSHIIWKYQNFEVKVLQWKRNVNLHVWKSTKDWRLTCPL